MAEAIVKIEGMTCGHCVETVTKALKGLSGVTEASVSLEENLARVDYDAARVGPAEIRKAIEAAGFDVTGDA